MKKTIFEQPIQTKKTSRNNRQFSFKTSAKYADICLARFFSRKKSTRFSTKQRNHPGISQQKNTAHQTTMKFENLTAKQARQMLNSQEERGITMLMHLLYKNPMQLEYYLQALSCNDKLDLLQRQDHNGNTALMIAAVQGPNHLDLYLKSTFSIEQTYALLLKTQEKLEAATKTYQKLRWAQSANNKRINHRTGIKETAAPCYHF
jgi:ankyrin repeat protein